MKRTLKVWESVMLFSLEKERKGRKKKEEKEKEIESNLVFFFPKKQGAGCLISCNNAKTVLFSLRRSSTPV